MAGLAGILAQGDIPAIVRPVFDRGPMAPDDFKNARIVIFGDLQTGNVIANLQRGFSRRLREIVR